MTNVQFFQSGFVIDYSMSQKDFHIEVKIILTQNQDNPNSFK